VLGAVFLVMTGGEALYADMGHFGAFPIRLAWFAIVMPGLLLNYFGQGALLLSNPAAVDSPFFHLVQPSMILPLTVLSTVAAVIASQALISAVFSLSRRPRPCSSATARVGIRPHVGDDHRSDLCAGDQLDARRRHHRARDRLRLVERPCCRYGIASQGRWRSRRCWRTWWRGRSSSGTSSWRGR
jgi:hypothetical protein